jgi:adenine-specific DNA-methyltransferase
MSGKTKLDLIWIGKPNRPRLEPRILLDGPEKSYHAAHKGTKSATTTSSTTGSSLATTCSR